MWIKNICLQQLFITLKWLINSNLLSENIILEIKKWKKYGNC